MVNLMRRREMMATLGPTPPTPTPSIDDYVKSGIILWLDGIKNTRSGHDSSASAWQDLSGNSYDYTYNSSSVVSDKYCVPNGKLTNSKNRPTNQVTIEVVMDYVPNGATQMLLPWGGNGYKTVWLSSTSSAIFFSAGSSNGAKGLAFLSGVNTYTAESMSSMFINGVAGTIIPASASWSTGYQYIGYYNSSSPRNCVSKIYAIRMYNRALTAEELLQNAQIDRARFGGST